MKALDRDFYRNGDRWHARCKDCYYVLREGTRYTPRFEKQDPQLIAAILQTMKTEPKLKNVARKHGIKYTTLWQWSHAGKLRNANEN